MPVRLHTRVLVLIALLFAALSMTAPAFAQSLDQLRASGAIGERWDGYVVVRDPGAAGAQATATKVNAERKKLYAKRASNEGATPEQVGQVYAQQIVQQVPKGTWILQQNGQWTQK
ncbi:MAG: YdbL family protein [Pseudomonadota bacterium]